MSKRGNPGKAAWDWDWRSQSVCWNCTAGRLKPTAVAKGQGQPLSLRCHCMLPCRQRPPRGQRMRFGSERGLTVFSEAFNSASAILYNAALVVARNSRLKCLLTSLAQRRKYTMFEGLFQPTHLIIALGVV